MFENFSKYIWQAWERGGKLLWGLSAASFVAFLILLSGWWLKIAPAVAAFENYGLWVFIAFMTLAVLAAFRAWEARPAPSLNMTANVQQSFWSQSRQTDGRVTTQYVFRMTVSNFTDEEIYLSDPRLVRPWVWGRPEVLEAHVIVEHPTDNVYSSTYPILPRRTTPASGIVILNKEIGKAGKRITLVVSIADQRGRRHKLKLVGVRAINQNRV